MTMSTLNTETLPREIVWKVNSKPLNNIESPRTEPKKVKNPVRVKELIEKTFQRLSVQLVERVNNLESELDKLKAENAELKSKLSLQLNQAS